MNTGNWTDATKWDTNPSYPRNGFPGAGDLYNAVFPANVSPNVSLSGNIKIEHLSSASSLLLFGAGSSLTLNDGFSFSGSAVAPSQNIMRVSLNLDGGTSTVSGTTSIELLHQAAINNRAILEIQNNGHIGGNLTSNLSTFNNLAGATFRKTAGVGVSRIAGGLRFNNAGTVAAHAGTLQFGFDVYNHAGGTLRVESGASIQFQSPQTFGSGRLEGNGSIGAGTLLTASGATIAPGLSAGTLLINGNLNFGALATLSIEIGGTDPGITYDLLNVDGTMVAGGLLEVSLINGFTPGSDSSFTVVDGTSAISGSFVNVANGGRVTLDDGTSFLVNYGAGSAFPDRVVLSDFRAVPEPRLWGVFGGAGLLLWAIARRPVQSSFSPRRPAK
ncbi:MAG: hypothetical protein AB7O66_03500 [Limisphaerales bacterium]